MLDVSSHLNTLQGFFLREHPTGCRWDLGPVLSHPSLLLPVTIAIVREGEQNPYFLNETSPFSLCSSFSSHRCVNLSPLAYSCQRRVQSACVIKLCGSHAHLGMHWHRRPTWRREFSLLRSLPSAKQLSHPQQGSSWSLCRTCFAHAHFRN